MDTLLTTLRAATQEEWLTFMQLQNERGIPLFHAAAEAAEKVVPVAQPKKRTVAPKKVAVPVVSGADAPEASEYRVAEADIDHSVCLGRVLKGGEDKRWAPIIFREKQCGGKLVEGSDLCTVCSKRESKYADESKPGPWTGRVTEDPLDWVHMLGTAWAEQKNPKFSAAAAAAAAAASDSASDSGASEEMEAVVPVSDKKAAASDKKAAEKAEKAAEKEAAKAAKAAEKAAEKEAAKAAKEAEKEAAKAAKEAEKAAKAAAAAPKKATEKAAVAPKKAAVVAPKKAVVAAAPVDVEFELKMIGDDMYAIKQGNVYEWDADAEKCGDFVGRLTGEEDDPSIDTDAAEVTV